MTYERPYNIDKEKYTMLKLNNHIKSVRDTSVLMFSILEQVLALKKIISQLDSRNTNLSVSFKYIKNGKTAQALSKRFSLSTLRSGCRQRKRKCSSFSVSIRPFLKQFKHTLSSLGIISLRIVKYPQTLSINDIEASPWLPGFIFLVSLYDKLNPLAFTYNTHCVFREQRMAFFWQNLTTWGISTSGSIPSLYGSYKATLFKCNG